MTAAIAEVIGHDKSNPHLRVPVEANSGIDLTGTILSLDRCGYKLGYYSVSKIEMDDETIEIPNGFSLPVEGKAVCFHARDCQFNLTVSKDNTCVVRTDSTPRLRKVWLVLMLVHVDHPVQL